MAAPSPASIVVREAADDKLAHGDLTFAIGFAAIIGGGIITFVGASLLRIAGWL